MTQTTPPFEDLLALIDDRSAAFRAAVTAGDITARVPGCPDWSVGDLVAHLGEVQRFWAAVAAAGPADEAPTVGSRQPTGDLLTWSAESTRLLIEALREAGPDTGCYTWWQESGAPATVGAVARHQVQEAAVHAWDAQEAADRPEPLPAAVAVDSIAEFLQVALGTLGPWPHRPARLTFSAIEGPTWTVDLTPSGSDPDPAAAGDPVATLHGPASDLLLVLYCRIAPEAVTVTGDRSAVDELLTWIDND